MRRNVRIGILVCLGGVLAWRTHSCVSRIDAKQRAAQAETERFLERTAEEPSTLPFNPQKRRALLAGVYRLQPDRRFLLAFEAIARLTGTPEEPVSPVFRDGAWVLQVGKQELGRVPELPGFGDLFARLIAYAKPRLPDAASRASAERGRALAWVDEARADLPRALERWRTSRPRDALASAARSSAALSFYMVDLLEVSDRLPAEALALAALLEASGGDARSEKALLASALGYGQEARALAPPARAEPALHAYLLGDDAALGEAARLREATPADRYLHVRRAFDARNGELAGEFLDSYHGVERFTLPILAQRLRDGHMRRYTPVAYSLPVFLLTAAEGIQLPPAGPEEIEDAAQDAAKRLGIERQDASQRLETALGKLDEENRLFFRALQVSGMRRVGDYFAEDQSNRDSSEKFAASLKSHPSSEVRDYQKWFAARTSLMRRSPLEALAAVESLQGVGGAAVVELLDKARERASFGDPRVLRAVRALIPRLDTRPSHRARFGEIAWTDLQDLRLSDKLLGSALKADPGHYIFLEEWFARLHADGAGLLRLARDRSAPTWVRADAAEHLFELGGAQAAQAEKAARALVSEQPKDRTARFGVEHILRGSGREAEGRAMLAEWLRGNDGQTLEAADMRGRIAACDYRMGHYQDGWSMAEPALESWHMNPMAWGALNLAGLGRAEEARRLASNVITRYASADAVSTAAEVEWRLGDPSAAAKRFREPPLPLTDIDFERDVGKAFVRIYSARPPADAVRAVEALLSVVRRASLDELGIALENAKAYEQAFAVHERLAQGAGVEGGTRFFILLRAADALEKVRGVAASREWLAAQLPRPLSDFDARQLALLAFMNGLPQLVWELPAEPKGGEDEAETFWMLRAAAVALQGADAPAERRDALHRHYASTKSLSHYFALGQYLMGELPESDAAKMVTNNTRACEYPYYFALKATGEKRFADASDWYHVALECGSRQEAEYRFAQADLYRWRAEKNPFAKLNGATATAGAPR